MVADKNDSVRPVADPSQEPGSGLTGIWSLYLIRNRLGYYYCGVTTDIARRFREHQANGARCARSLRGKGPLTLCHVIEVGDKSRALRLEIRVKRLNRKAKDALIAGTLDWRSL